jgi:hypothetical protein
MKRTNLNFIIDAAGFAGFIFLTATGVLVRYVLPPGSGHHTTLWGLDRHEWGSVHFWIAIGFLCVLALHVVLHWRWIVCVIRGRPREGSGVRLALGVVAVIGVLAVAVAPLATPVERAATRTPRSGESLSSDHDSESVRGRMSLNEIEKQTGVPATHLIEHFGMPSDVPLDVGVAKLGKQYGFEIADVRTAISEYKTEH